MKVFATVVFLVCVSFLQAQTGKDSIPSLKDSVIEEDATAKEMKLTLFPNPTATSATLRFHLYAPQALTIDIVDANENVVKIVADQVFNGQDPSVYIQTTGMPPGVYKVRIKSGGSNVIAVKELKVER